MNIYSEDTGGLVLIKNVSVIQVGWKAGYMNKKVSAVAAECWDSVSGHVYTDNEGLFESVFLAEWLNYLFSSAN